jgi:hypothetical protein
MRGLPAALRAARAHLDAVAARGTLHRDAAAVDRLQRRQRDGPGWGAPVAGAQARLDRWRALDTACRELAELAGAFGRVTHRPAQPLIRPPPTTTTTTHTHTYARRGPCGRRSCSAGAGGRRHRRVAAGRGAATGTRGRAVGHGSLVVRAPPTPYPLGAGARLMSDWAAKCGWQRRRDRRVRLLPRPASWCWYRARTARQTRQVGGSCRGRANVRAPGGTDSMDWTQMLLRMYARWAERDSRYQGMARTVHGAPASD